MSDSNMLITSKSFQYYWSYAMSVDEQANFLLQIDGFCPICEKPSKFIAIHRWLRDSLNCTSCDNGSVPRERALALALNRFRPAWRRLKIHESSPCNRGISAKLRREAKYYTGSEFHPDVPRGQMVGPYRCEDLEAQTFPDESFDIVITLDVFEHIFNPGGAHKEIWRTLKPGGVHICTFPIKNDLVPPLQWRAHRQSDGSVRHVMEPEYHSNPTNPEQGALVTVDYGYAIHQQIPLWAPFDVEISRFYSNKAGILGEYTEVIVCTKRAA